MPFDAPALEAADLRFRITAVQAARYLDLRFDHFAGLRSELHERTARTSRRTEIRSRN
jgi:hypothetical protein